MASHSHVVVYHGPLHFATFWEWLAIHFHRSVHEAVNSNFNHAFW